MDNYAIKHTISVVRRRVFFCPNANEMNVDSIKINFLRYAIRSKSDNIEGHIIGGGWSFGVNMNSTHTAINFILLI